MPQQPTNPYQIPTPPDAGLCEPGITIGDVEFPPGMKRGMVGHVQVLGILMIIHGVIDALAAVTTAVYAFFVPVFLQGAGPGGRPAPENFQTYIVWFLGIVTVVFFFTGVAKVVGGVWASQFQSRRGVMATLVAGLLMLASCYCFPTSLALFVYGFVVLHNDSTRFAFELGERGIRPQTIQQLFLSLEK